MGFEHLMAFVLTPALLWVIALYFVKSKPRFRKLPTIALWQAVIERVNEHALWSRYRGTLFLLIQLLAITVGILAIARPFSRGGIDGDVVIVLDTSASMKARDGSPTRFDAARTAAMKLISRVSSRTRIAIVETAPVARILLPFTQDAGVVKARLKGIQCSSAPGATPSDVLALVGSIKTKDTRHLFVYGDGFDGASASAALPGALIQLHSFARRGDNVGIVACRVVGTSGHMGISVNLRNFASRASKGFVELHEDTGKKYVRPFEVPASSETESGEQSIQFPELTFSPDVRLLRVRLSNIAGSDLLSDDNHVWLRFRRERLKVAIISRRSQQVLQRVLTSFPHLEPISIAPSEVARRLDELGRMSAVVADDYLVDELLSFPLVLFHPAIGSSLSSGMVAANPRPFVSDPTHPLVRYLAFPGLTIKRAVGLDKVDDAVTVIGSEAGPLVMCRAVDGLRQVICAFPLNRTNLRYKVGFPIFLTNALRWIIGDSLAVAVSHRAGERPEFDPAWSNIAVVHGDPVPQGVLPISEEATRSVTSVVPLLRSVGVYGIVPANERLAGNVLFEKLISSKQDKGLYAVNLLSSIESDIRPKGPTRLDLGVLAVGVNTGSGKSAGYWYYLLLSFVVVVSMEWLFYSWKGN